MDIFKSIKLNEFEEVENYVNEGNDINIINEIGENLLHISIFHNKKKISKFLIENGININLQDLEKWTPLHAACFLENNIEIIKLLLENGADLEILNTDNKTPLEYITNKNDLKEINNFIKIPFIKIEKINKISKLPTKANKGDSGYDVFSTIDIILEPQKVTKIPLGIKWQPPKNNFKFGWEIQVRSKSGLASRGIFVANSPGTVDSNYKDEICVLLFNSTILPFEIKINQKIAQIIFNKVYNINLIETNMIDKINDRGGGFGSSGEF